MSIQTELTRITNAKSAIKAAIEGKGVTVPDGTMLDGMAALIEAIEAGGGGGNTSVVSLITFNEDTLTFTFEHNLGQIPNQVLIAITDSGQTNVRDIASAGLAMLYSGKDFGRRIYNPLSYANSDRLETSRWIYGAINAETSYVIKADETSFTAYLPSAYKASAGATFLIVVAL